MRIKKFLRLLSFILLVMIASMVPFPMNFSRKDKSPSFEIELVDENDDDDEIENDYQAYS